MPGYKPGDSVTVVFTTRVFSTGVGTNADSTPTAILNRNGTDDGAVTPVVSNLDTGRYKAVFTIPATYLPGDVLNLSVAATVSTIADKAAVWHCKVDVGFLATGRALAGSTSTTIVLQTALGVDGLPVRSMIAIVSGSGLGQVRNVAAYVDSTKTLTVDNAWTVTPDTTSVYAIIYGAWLPSDLATEANATANKSAILTAIGTPAQAATLSTNQTALLSAIGTPAQASGLTGLATEANATTNKSAILTAIGSGGGGGGGGSVTGFTDGALLALRASLTGVVLTRRGPVFSDGGQLSITLVCGDDYLLADGRQIDLDLDGTSLPDLTGASVWLRLASGVKVAVAGSVVVATGSTRTVRFQPAAAITSTLTAGENGVFAVKIMTASGHVLSPNEARGVLTVLARVVI
jgi:hypothetical protein